MLLYVYDEAGTVIGLKYRTSSYAEGVYDCYFFEKNLQGDIIAIYNESGTKIGGYTYDAWGKVTTYTSTGITTLEQQIVQTYNPFRYRGYYYDIETGLYYLQSRYYNPEWGRFLSADAIAVITASPTMLTDKNLYAYCDNNPITRRDDGGEFWNFIIGGAVGLVTGAISAVISSYALDGKIDWVSVGVSAGVGLVSGVIGATGLGLVAQAGLSAVTSSVGNFAEQTIKNGGDFDKINYGDVVLTGIVSGGTSAVGGLIGKAVGGKIEAAAQNLINKGRDKLLTGMVRRSLGQSSSKIMKDGYKFIAQGTKQLNFYQGMASCIGSGLSMGTGSGYSFAKRYVMGW